MVRRLLILILLLPIANAALSNYPEPFVRDNLLNYVVMVIGNGNVQTNTLVAVDIVLGLPTNKGASKTLFDTEIKTIEGNLVVVGTPCDNKITAQILETNDCHSGLGKGEAMLRLVQKGGSAILIVTAYGNEELRNLGKIVRNYNSYKQFFVSDTILVKDSKIEPYSYIPKSQEKKEKNGEISKPAESIWTRFIKWLKGLFSM